MTTKITDAICRAIAQEFGETYAVYREEVRQNAQTPAFLAELQSAACKPRLAGRKFHILRFRIRYFPKQNNSRAEIYAVQERLRQALQEISLEDGPLRGLHLEGSPQDGTFCLSVEYHYFSREPEESREKMGSVSYFGTTAKP